MEENTTETENKNSGVNLPADVLTTVINACKQNLFACLTFEKFTIDEQVAFLANMKEYGFFKELMESSTMAEIVNDVKVQSIIRDTNDIFKMQITDLEKAIKILSNE